jgi:hypothetical protein
MAEKVGSKHQLSPSKQKKFGIGFHRAGADSHETWEGNKNLRTDSNTTLHTIHTVHLPATADSNNTITQHTQFIFQQQQTATTP